MFDNEFNGGGESLPDWASFRQGYADVPFTAASVIQALEGGIVMFNPWTLTSSLYGVWTQHGTDGCENAMIELSDSCDVIPPDVQSDLLPVLPDLRPHPDRGHDVGQVPGGLEPDRDPDDRGRRDGRPGGQREPARDGQLSARAGVLAVRERLDHPARPGEPDRSVALELSLPISGSAGPLAFTVPALGVMLLQFD